MRVEMALPVATLVIMLELQNRYGILYIFFFVWGRSGRSKEVSHEER
jgi:ABC-type antimicrobial peptide transport system ATPase subunit